VAPLSQAIATRNVHSGTRLQPEAYSDGLTRMFDDRDQRSGEWERSSLEGRAVQPASEPALDCGVSVLDGGSERPWISREQHDWLDAVNAAERSLAIWQAAPECPDCFRGVTDQDEPCERCLGEGRLLP
jgi:hypothetical protein